MRLRCSGVSGDLAGGRDTKGGVFGRSIIYETQLVRHYYLVQ